MIIMDVTNKNQYLDTKVFFAEIDIGLHSVKQPTVSYAKTHFLYLEYNLVERQIKKLVHISANKNFLRNCNVISYDVHIFPKRTDLHQQPKDQH